MSSNYPPNYPPNIPPNPPPPPQMNRPPQMPVAAKKSGPWLWILAGCGTLLVIAVIAVAGIGYFAYRKAKQAGLDTELLQKNPALASAKMIVAMNPDLELISTDDENGTLTIKDKKSGKVITVNTQDIKDGKITFSDEKNENVSIKANANSGGLEIKTGKETVKVGSGSAVNTPDWLPTYPGAGADGTASMQNDEGNAGTLHFITQDSVEEVLSYYEQGLEGEGLKVTTNTAKQNGEVISGTAVGKGTGEKRNATVIASASDKGTNVIVSYQTKK